MKVTVISYSLSGNNDRLASNIASEFNAEHIKISEIKRRTMGRTMFDMMFNRTPKVKPSVNNIDSDSSVIFAGPVWIGKPATPLRACFKELKGKVDKYSFVSISGGADGPNPKLEEDLVKRMGMKPVALIDMHKADLVPQEPKPTREITSSYKLTDEDLKNITAKAINELKKTIA
jgi:flavodoxin